ncbi:hypothetical protein Patl1_22069 [Pistacia atlantica]|uniref:Uncharacterized protein n=1 Tax=Pistacia atlantica TaxID=434234 RepID=A0ACC1BJW7_9ROSI|nr:hypothetical protein Patl1_22069 [Pistacia atlantica]
MVTMGELWATLGSVVASAMFVSAIFKQYFPYQLWGYRSEAFSAIQNYLSTKASLHATRFKADFVKDSQSCVLSMEDREEVTDEFKGVKVWSGSASYSVTILAKIGISGDQQSGAMYNLSILPTFDTLAMETQKKEEIKKDLKKFREGKEYYTKIGKAWKRGYLLYGPPGTGKSTMIAAMANYLNYDVYDLELTTVMDNSELRSLLIETTNKSIIVIEDIDCSLDLTGQREKKKEKDGDEEKKNPIEKKMKEDGENKASKVTLSGLLNFIDGLWSACGGERLIVFTTNYVDKLDPALIRRGRMDKHIEMSYCGFEAFKVLAKNYLDIDSHELFAEVGYQLAETNMTPADVAENLMPKSDEDDAETCLKNLIEGLKVAKEEAIKKAEEEARLKAEQAEKEEEEKAKEADCKEENKKGDETAANSVKENGSIDKEVK